MCELYPNSVLCFSWCELCSYIVLCFSRCELCPSLSCILYGLSFSRLLSCVFQCVSFVQILSCVFHGVSFVHLLSCVFHGVSFVQILSCVFQRSIMLCALFIFTWTPYAVLSFVTATITSDIPVNVSTLPSMIAKSSTVFNPIIYYLAVQNYRQRALKLFTQYFNTNRKRSLSSSEELKVLNNIPIKRSDKQRIMRTACSTKYTNGSFGPNTSL